MTEEIMEMILNTRDNSLPESVLRPMCEAVAASLEARLKPGVTVEQCRGAFLLACCRLVWAWVEETDDWSGLRRVQLGDTAVELTQRDSIRLRDQAMELMAPWLKDSGFVFMGVNG